jgi:hypothetical protein
MKPGKRALLLFLAAPLLIGFGAGCGDFWQAPTTTTGTCTTNCTTASSSNFYILDGGTNPGIVGNSIVSGALTSIGSPTLLGEGVVPYSMAIDPAGNFLVVGSSSGAISFPITNGSLGAGVTVTTDQAAAVQVDATSHWLIEAIPILAGGGVTIGAVPIDPTTGAGNGTEQSVTYTTTVATAAVRTNQMALSGDNQNLFVPLGPGGTVVIRFTACSATGCNPLPSQGTIIPVVNAGGNALSVAVDPVTTSNATPRLFYIGENLGTTTGGTAGPLRVFNYSSLGTSTITQATGSPIASGGLEPSFILPLSTGTYAGGYVYVASNGSGSAGTIAGFTITASTAATPVYTIATDTTVAAGAQPLAMAEDSTGTFVFEVGSGGSPYFDAYTFDATSLGQLDSQIASTAQGNAMAIVAAPQ